MMQNLLVFFLLLSLLLLVSVILYQQFAFHKGIRRKLTQMSRTLAHILEQDSDEKVMVFTGDPALTDLASQINLLLEDRQHNRAEYRRSENAYKKMLSNISHDIKTPLTVIAGYLELLRLQEPENPMLQRAEQKTEQVMELIRQFFTLAKLEAGDADLQLSRIDLGEICRESVVDFYELLTRNAFQVQLSIPEYPIPAMGDAKALQRILGNLISNAIRYGSEGRYLGLTLHCEEFWAYIDVTDRGKGIDKTAAANVFERLFTLEDSRNREIQGNGLGLTIAKSLARQLGGDLTLSSEPHVQTTFTLKLPRLTF